MWGRPSRREMAEEIRQHREREKARERARPRWRRVLSWAGRHKLLAVLTVLPILATFAAVTWVQAWRRWPGPVTAVLSGGYGWTATGPLGWPWWAGLPLLPAAIAAGVIHARRRPRPVVVPDDFVALWRTQVADGADAPARGSRVADRVTPLVEDGRVVGRTLYVTGASSTQHVGYFRAAVDRLAAIYRVDPEAITVRAVGDHSRCAIDILHQAYVEDRTAARLARVTQTQPWSGPSLEPDGRFRIMTVAEDGRPGYGRLWTPDGGVHDIDLSGVKGAGKSCAADVILASVMSASMVVLDIVDLKGGASLSHWRPVAYRYSTTLEEAEVALDRAIAVMYARLKVMAATPVVDEAGRPVLVHGQPAIGVTHVDPSPTWPVYLLVLEEFPRLIKHKRLEARVAELVDLSRAADVSLMVVHQGTGRGEGWGDNTQIRTNITKSGTTVALRNDAQSGARTVGAGVDLAALGEDTPGEGWMRSPAERGQIYGRVQYIGDRVAAVRACRPAIPGELIEEAVGQVEREHAERAAAAVREREAEDARRVAAAEAVVSGGSGSMLVMPASTAPVLTYGTLTAAQRRVWDLFARVGVGVAVTTQQALDGATVAGSTFHAISRRFVTAGVLVDLGRGQWAATAALMERSKT